MLGIRKHLHSVVVVVNVIVVVCAYYRYLPVFLSYRFHKLFINVCSFGETEPHTHTRARKNHASNFHSEIRSYELRRSNIFWITYDYLNILKCSLNGTAPYLSMNALEHIPRVIFDKGSDFHSWGKFCASISLSSYSKVSYMQTQSKSKTIQCKTLTAAKHPLLTSKRKESQKQTRATPILSLKITFIVRISFGFRFRRTSVHRKRLPVFKRETLAILTQYKFGSWKSSRFLLNAAKEKEFCEK